MKNIFFFASIEGDVLIFSSISKIIRKYFLDSKTTIITPEHPRLKGDKLNDSYSAFDERIIVSNPSSKKNIFSGFSHALNYKKELGKLIIPENSIIFLFDIYKLSEIIFYSFIERIKNRKKLKTVVVTPYLSDPFNKKRAKLLVKDSIIASAYSILFANLRLTKRYQIRNTKITGFLKVKQKTDFQISIGNSNHRTIAKTIFDNIPYPLITYLKDKSIKDESEILLLVSTNHGKRWNTYWNNIYTITKIVRDDSNATIYVKDHPGVKSLAENYLGSISGLIFLNNKINAEQLYLDPQYNICTVIGYGSTAILTASWLGYKVIDYTNLLGYDKYTLDYYDDFLKLGNDIIRLNEVSELKPSTFSKSVNTNFKERVQEVNSKWHQILSKIINAK